MAVDVHIPWYDVPVDNEVAWVSVQAAPKQVHHVDMWHPIPVNSSEVG